MKFDTDFKAIKEGTCFIDRTSWLKEMPCMGFVVYGPCGCGKSVLLSMVARFYGDSFHSEGLFKDTAVGKDAGYCSKYMNRYPVIYISFRDFSAEDYESARKYMGSKMAETYHHFIHRFLDGCMLGWRDMNFYMDILQGKADERMLGNSLTRLLHFFDRRGGAPKPVLLIDDYNRLAWTAGKNGYESQMTALCRNWLDSRLTDYTEYFAVTGELYDSWYNHYNGSEDVFASCIGDGRLKDYFLLTEDEAGNDGRDIGREVRRYHDIIHRHGFWDGSGREEDGCGRFFTYSLPKKMEGNIELHEKFLLDERSLELVFNSRKRALEEEYSECRDRLSRFRKHQERYASQFPADLDIGTKFAGARTVPDWPETAAYTGRDGIIKKLYSHYKEYGTSEESIYMKLQNIDEKTRTDWFSAGGGTQLSGIMEKHSSRWARLRKNSSDYWNQVSALKSNGDDANYLYLKVYISAADCKVTNIFLDAVERLLDTSENSFWAKVSLKKRDESMCFWIRRNELPILDAVASAWHGQITKPLLFVAYRGGLGVSRELYSYSGSNNRIQAILLKDYFRHAIGTDRNVGLRSLYQFLVDRWNDEGCSMNDDNPFSDMSALVLIVMLETMDAIIHGKEISDGHFLLNDDDVLWKKLWNCKCWKALAEGGQDLFLDF